MNRRTLLASALLLPLVAPFVQHPAWADVAIAPPPLTAQDRADIARVEAYMNILRSFKARFLQVSPEGATAQGTVWLSRPGRMRFEYDKPNPTLLVAGFGSAVFYDAELKQTTSVPLFTTPLSLLLADNLKLSGDVTVTSVSRQPGALQLTMHKTSSANDGSLTLVFSDNPLQLRQWAVTDAQRQETRVSLFNMELGGNFPAEMFQFEDPRLGRGSNGN